MNELLVQSLISVGAGLLGALIGFMGSLIATIWSGKIARQQVQITRDQVRFNRAHERRDEVLGNIYGMLMDLNLALFEWSARPHASEGAKEQLSRIVALGSELNHYSSRNIVWVPTDIAQELAELHPAFGAKVQRVAEVRSEAEYNAALGEASEWLQEGAGAERTVRIQSMIRDALGVPELESRRRATPRAPEQ
jgi:hypothetical protein